MIRVSGLTKSYGAHRALAGVDFEIEAGEVVGFLGPNGAGKSTTMRILTGVLRPDEGQVNVAGRDVLREPLQARRQVGYLPEHTPLYRRMRVGDYLEFVGQVHGLARRERRAAIARVHGQCSLEGTLRRRIDELSKGYRQRVGLAQALLSDPAVLVLDEPTSGLDPNEVARLRALIAELGQTKTVLLSTHVLPEVEEVCSRVLILAGGRLVADDSLEAIGASQSQSLQVVLRAPAGAAHELLAGVVGVARVGVPRDVVDACVAFELAIDGDSRTSERVSAAIASKGWALVELTRRTETLASVFQRSTARVVDQR
ncbi:ATP-binding cassette domain-containing protein [Engelhardtia mirabilis]|uniref:Putative ABC transporter ATP-binding protein YxlF n=1 Tax=Engelhardtia mirabilis TaxID=2528011 RepID=A0A518BJ86_9BACT|nr:putative ABC transporter ATP-binding protein YxlF [Planctomycetes bacterium Pla133]QDV01355.1 putative ABC transporter ATP-binding protein YxlF [Planctomycetes bacterium Pla86]